LRDASGRLSPHTLVPVAVAATVFAFACGSSSVRAVNEAGKPLRWVLLFVLLAVAVAAAWASRRRDRVLPAPSVVAAATLFVALALVSSLWSVDGRLSAGRAASLAILFAVAGLLGLACAGRPEEIRRVLSGLVAGAAAVAVAGLVVLLVDRSDAVQSATLELPARFQGLGENPNTVALLLALVLPIAVCLVLEARSWRSRAGAIALVLLFDGSIAASSSRGALVAAFVGTIVVIALAPLAIRTRAVAGAVAVALAAASLGIALVPQPATRPAAAQPAAAAPPPAKRPAPRYVDAEALLPLSFDIGSRVPGVNTEQPRSFLGSSGRSLAWQGALDEAAKRPILGYGFGTEGRVFVDRYALFTGDLPENAYIGLDLQLGAVGLIAFLALAVALLAAMGRGLRRSATPACLGVFVAGLVLALVQSYIYSVGNVGTATLWICAFLGVAAAVRPGQEQ
jgi:hypothetical protein